MGRLVRQKVAVKGGTCVTHVCVKLVQKVQKETGLPEQQGGKCAFESGLVSPNPASCRCKLLTAELAPCQGKV